MTACSDTSMRMSRPTVIISLPGTTASCWETSRWTIECSRISKRSADEDAVRTMLNRSGA